MKKLLFIMPSLTGGGAEKVLIDLFNHLSPQEYKISLMLKDRSGIYVSQIPNTVKIIPLRQYSKKVSSILLRFKGLRNILWKRDAMNAIGDRRFDAIISFCEGASVVYHSFITKCALKNISWVHINLAINHWCSFIFGKKAVEKEQRIYQMMDSIVFVSDGAKSAFSQMFGLTNNLHTIHNVIDRDLIVSRAGEFNIKRERFTICNIGRLDYQKRQDRIIEMAAVLKNKGYDFEVWILGLGKLENKLKELASSLGVSDRIKFLGFQNNPYPYLMASDMFLLTSDTEGYPTVVCEALCLGKPIVSTAITGSEELLKDGVGVLTSLNVSDITAKVEEFINDESKMAKFSESALKKSREFSPETIVSQIDELI